MPELNTLSRLPLSITPQKTCQVDRDIATL
ncbi:hypothetical protein P775_12040 [Puniceibacterium antarcticum]|uniref:Uncharacterized protein n=1 Tax=Puniceibacterium antarcticum TaxID=1206336 RepID=A0A2G8REP4_9RHOB|nr:hypothetical protein P775_12040 [Puniceibacterium antarcticum]